MLLIYAYFYIVLSCCTVITSELLGNGEVRQRNVKPDLKTVIEGLFGTVLGRSSMWQVHNKELGVCAHYDAVVIHIK